MKTHTRERLVARATRLWEKNKALYPQATVAVFDKHGQYHGAFVTKQEAEEYVARCDDTEGWISGPVILKFRNAKAESHE